MLIDKLDDTLMYVAKLNVGVIAIHIYQYEILDHIDSIEELTEQEKKLNKSLINMFIDNDYMLLENTDNYLVKLLQ